MTQLYEILSKCRICQNESLVVVLDLGDHALSGVFPKTLDCSVPTAPLALVKCTECGLVQLSVSVSLSEMYGDNYGYRSGLNASMLEHLKSKVKKIENFIELSDDNVVIDIGSNDASTLKSYQNQSLTLVGVDPTGFKFIDYYPDHIKLITEFFPSKSLFCFLDGRKAKVITSFSMFYDLEDPIKFAQSIASSLAEDGIWVFEQSYAPLMITQNSFDTVCHEHLEYYNLKQLKFICDRANLKIVDIEFNNINGGSISIIAAGKSSDLKEFNELAYLLDKEESDGFNSLDIYAQFQSSISIQKDKLLDFLRTARESGESVYALGASTKGNTLLQYWGIDSSLITAIGEVNRDKFGSFTPGTKIPIIAEDEVLAKNPDFIIVLPWHFSKFFKDSKKFSKTSLIFPLPTFEVNPPINHE